MPTLSNLGRKKFPEFQPFRPCEAAERCEDPPEIPLQHVGSYKGELLVLSEVIQKSAALCKCKCAGSGHCSTSGWEQQLPLKKKGHKRARRDAN